jgi:hypothetical protein
LAERDNFNSGKLFYPSTKISFIDTQLVWGRIYEWTKMEGAVKDPSFRGSSRKPDRNKQNVDNPNSFRFTFFYTWRSEERCDVVGERQDTKEQRDVKRVYLVVWEGMEM